MIYDKIKTVCKKRGISVTHVEKKAGLSNGAISKWNESSPTVENLQAVAKVLKTTIDDLLEEEEAISCCDVATRPQENGEN